MGRGPGEFIKSMSFSEVKFLKTFSIPSLERVVAAALAAAKIRSKNEKLPFSGRKKSPGDVCFLSGVFFRDVSF